MLFLRILRGIAVLLVSCIMFGMVSSMAILGYRFYQMQTLESFSPDSMIELLVGPNRSPQVSVTESPWPETIKPETVLGTSRPELKGPLPVGRWACFRIPSFETNRKTNDPALVTRCDIHWRMYQSEVIELREDSSGNVLYVPDFNEHNRYLTDPDIVRFKVTHSPFLYVQRQELRWIFSIDGDNFALELQTERVYYVPVKKVSNSLLLRLDERQGWDYLVRISSPEYIMLIQYAECTESNDNRNLWEVKDCGIPFKVDS